MKYQNASEATCGQFLLTSGKLGISLEYPQMLVSVGLLGQCYERNPLISWLDVYATVFWNRGERCFSGLGREHSRRVEPERPKYE